MSKESPQAVQKENDPKIRKTNIFMEHKARGGPEKRMAHILPISLVTAVWVSVSLERAAQTTYSTEAPAKYIR